MTKLTICDNTYTISIEPDYAADYPWENSDGHGIVRKSNRPHRDGQSDKKPSERPLNSASRNEYQFYYDVAASLKVANRDGWNAKPYDAPNKAQRAVDADFERLRAYLANDWGYVVVTVSLDGTDKTESCSMVESDYTEEVARDLAYNIEAEIESEIHSAHVSNRFRDSVNLGVTA